MEARALVAWLEGQALPFLPGVARRQLLLQP